MQCSKQHAGLRACVRWSPPWSQLESVRATSRTASGMRSRSGNGAPASDDTTGVHAQGTPDDLKSSEEGGTDSHSKRNSFIMSIPTALTVMRVCAIPPVVYLVQFPEPSAAAWATTVFVAASITDWLDGYLARKMV